METGKLTGELSGTVRYVQGGGGSAEGGYYLPKVDEESGVLSWVPSSATLPAAESANVRGPQGLPGIDGKDGAPGADGAKGDKGDKGDAGYSPVKGTDYWTSADKAEIEGEVLNTLREGEIADINEELSRLEEALAELSAKAYFLNFAIYGGVNAPEAPNENDIWINTDTEITDWVFTTKNPFLTDLTIVANHGENNNYTDVIIVDNSDNSTIASQTITGTTSYSAFTDQVVSFTTKDGLDGTLTCSVRQSTSPFFVGEVVVNDVTIGEVAFGTGTNSSYAWTGTQTVIGNAGIEVNEGAVWFSTGSTSPVAFNALKKNGIQIYPISVSQYIGGTWTDKSAKSYINGEWKEWALYVFRNGAFIDTSFGTKLGTNCKAELLEGQIYIYGEGQSNTILYTTAQFDCTKFSKLVVVISKTVNPNSGAVGNLHIGVSDTKADINFVASSVIQPINLNAETEYTVDISAVSGSYYIKIADIRSGYFSDKIYIKEIRLA